MKKIFLPIFFIILLSPAMALAIDCSSVKTFIDETNSNNNHIYGKYTCDWDETGVGFCKVAAWETNTIPCIKTNDDSLTADLEFDSNYNSADYGIGRCNSIDPDSAQCCGSNCDSLTKFWYSYEVSRSPGNWLVIDLGNYIEFDADWSTATTSCTDESVTSETTHLTASGYKCCPDLYKYDPTEDRCVSTIECDDGKDNGDKDAIPFKDLDDPGCDSPSDDDETSACENDIDDDGDGCIDLADKGCNGHYYENSEEGGGCGCTDDNIQCCQNNPKSIGESCQCSAECSSEYCGEIEPSSTITCSEANPVCVSNRLKIKWAYEPSTCPDNSGSGGCENPKNSGLQLLNCESGGGGATCSSGDGCKTGCTPPDTDCSCSQIGGACCEPGNGQGSSYPNFDDTCSGSKECWDSCSTGGTCDNDGSCDTGAGEDPASCPKDCCKGVGSSSDCSGYSGCSWCNTRLACQYIGEYCPPPSSCGPWNCDDCKTFVQCRDTPGCKWADNMYLSAGKVKEGTGGNCVMEYVYDNPGLLNCANPYQCSLGKGETVVEVSI